MNSCSLLKKNCRIADDRMLEAQRLPVACEVASELLRTDVLTA